ncbi:homoserine dehydrogenase [Eubacterium sp.]|uniref:homoserine dehydrogenase n=1 Tax=Eubacterium sp. TaxID=142586 RepID=UPI0025D47C69|nr:homoserine dehydrogenase [Eubacterium sp.]MCR5628449.1 homoserine dehydrogenase [Eubacterium sp.]
MINVAVLGYGTVGSGVVEVINTNNELINKRVGDTVKIKYVLDLRDFPGDVVENILVKDYDVIVNDPEVSIIAEAMGGIDFPYECAKKAIAAGKSYCTSNKELVAKHGPELIKLAKENNVNFLFEASVGGGIPVIRPINESLTPDDIVEVVGILNGTTNYILSKMAKEGLDFDTVLKRAQDLGYAERNPEADVEGYDACRKIAILSSLATGKYVNFEDIKTEGITKITDVDFKYANLLGLSVKLFGRFKNVDGKYFAMVSPVMIDKTHPLYSVEDVKNGILVRGNMVGDVMFYGSGAGKLPTASAVVSDIIEAARAIGRNINIIMSDEKLELSDISEFESRFFVRVKNADKDAIESVFGDVEIINLGEIDDEVGFITRSMTEKAFAEAESKFDNVITRIRIM